MATPTVRNIEAYTRNDLTLIWSFTDKDTGNDIDVTSTYDEVRFIVYARSEDDVLYEATLVDGFSISGNTISCVVRDAQNKKLFGGVKWFKLNVTIGTTSKTFQSGRYLVYDKDRGSQQDTGFNLIVDNTTKVVSIETSGLYAEALAYASNLNRASIQSGDAGKIERIKEDESGWENVTASEAGIATEAYVDDKASLLGAFIPYTAEKNANNPIITGGLGTQFYPPGVMYYDGNYYAVAKDYANIRMYRSENGVTGWVDLGIVMRPSDIGWTSVSKLEGTKIFYNPDEKLFYMLNGVFHSTGNFTSVSIATSSNPEGPYEERGTPFIDGASNDTLAKFGTSYEAIEVPDMVRYKEQYWFFCVCKVDSTNSNSSVVASFRSPVSDIYNVSANRVFFSRDDINAQLIRNVDVLQGPVVFYNKGVYSMVFTAGGVFGGEGEREIYITHTKSAFSFEDLSLLQKSPFIDVGDSGSWEDRRVYFADVLKENDGYYLSPKFIDSRLRVYYSGHAVNGTVNIGVTGLAEFQVPIDSSVDESVDKVSRTNAQIASKEIVPVKYDNSEFIFERANFSGITKGTDTDSIFCWLPQRKEILQIQPEGYFQTYNPLFVEGNAIERLRDVDRTIRFSQPAIYAHYLQGLNKIAVLESDKITGAVGGSTTDRIVFFTENLKFNKSLSISTGKGWTKCAYVPQLDKIYIASRSGVVYVINGSAETFDTSITVDSGKELTDIVYDPVSKKIIVVNSTDVEIHKIDPYNANAVTTIDIPTLPSAYNCLIANGYLYVYAKSATGAQNIGAKVNTVDNTISYILNSATLGGVFSVAYNPINNVSYIFDHSSGNIKIHYLGSDVASTVSGDQFTTMPSPLSSMFCPISGNIWVANQNRTVNIFT